MAKLILKLKEYVRPAGGGTLGFIKLSPYTSYLDIILFGLNRLSKRDRNHHVDVRKIFSVIMFIQIDYVLVSDYT